MEEAMEQGHLFSKLTGANTLEEMRALPPEKIMQAVTVMMAEGFRTGSGLPFTAVIDGYLMEKGYDQVVEDGECPDIPYMIGSCGNDLGQTPEMTMRGGHCQLYYGCINWSLKNAELGRTPAYVYYFDRKLLGDYSGAFHSAELWYVFNTLSRSWRPKSQADYRLAEQINSYWVNFIKTGNPSCGEPVPVEWKAASDLFDYLDLGREIHLPTEEERSVFNMIWEMLEPMGECTLRDFQTPEIMPK